MVESNYIKPVEILIEQKFELGSVAIRADGLAQIKIISNLTIDVLQTKIIVDLLGSLGNKKRFPVLILVDKFTLPTAEARAYVAAPESDPYGIAVAYVVKSMGQKLVGNVYLSFNKPSRPTRIFTDEEKAITWLKTFL
jgi:hypothetical protein